MSERLNLEAARAFFEAWNAGDLNKADAYEAEDFIGEGPGAPGPMSAAQNRAYVQNFLTAFPGSKFEEWLTVAQGDYVVTHWKISGTHSAPLFSPSGAAIPPTGKRVTLTGSTTSQIKDGKVVRSWNFWDMSSMLSQLGLLPPM